MVKLNQRILYYSGGYDKRSQDGVFTTVTHVTPTGRFKIKIDDENIYDGESLRRRGKKNGSFVGASYCRLINEDNKKLELKATKRLWIDRIERVDLEKASTELLKSLISTLNQHKE